MYSGMFLPTSKTLACFSSQQLMPQKKTGFAVSLPPLNLKAECHTHHKIRRNTLFLLLKMTKGSELMGSYHPKVPVFSFVLFLSHTRLNFKTHTLIHSRKTATNLLDICLKCSLVTGSRSLCSWLVTMGNR